MSSSRSGRCAGTPSCCSARRQRTTPTAGVCGCKAGERIFWVRYSNLVVALGAIVRALPIPGLAEHALGFKSLADAIHLRNHVLGRLEIAAADPNPTHRRRELTFVFVGAGYAGVEALAELSDLVRAALRYYPELRDAPQQWVLVDAAPKILPESRPGSATTPHGSSSGAAWTSAPRRRSMRWSRTRPASRTATRSSRAPSSGRPASARRPPWARLRPSDGERGRVKVDEILRVTRTSNVWALGDCAAVPNLATPERHDPPTPSTPSGRLGAWRTSPSRSPLSVPDARRGGDARPLQGARERPRVRLAASSAGGSPGPTTCTSCPSSRGSSASLRIGRSRSSSAATSPSSPRPSTDAHRLGE